MVNSLLAFVRERRSPLIEFFTGVLAIILLPLIVRNTGQVTNPLFFVLGFNDILGLLTGQGGQTDVGWEVAGSAGLLAPNLTAYAPLDSLAPLIGMTAVESTPLLHPPPALALFIPFVAFPYASWLGSWVIGMVFAIAWSFRVMSVPIWISYPLAIALSLTRVGQFSLSTTYPLLAICLAVAWRYRSTSWLGGLPLALITASRGVGGLLLLYPLLRRQWKTLIIAVGALGILTFTALLFEPTVLRDYLVVVRPEIQVTMDRPLTTPYALAEYVGIPGFLAWLSVLFVGLAALWRGASYFWVLLWWSLAASPVAHAHSSTMLLPLGVQIWRTGRTGAFLMTLPLISISAFTLGVVMVWPIGIAATGLALVLSPPTDSGETLDRLRRFKRPTQR